MKIIKSLEESWLLIKRISKAIKNEVKEQKGRFLPILSWTLAATILGTALTGRGVIRAGEERITTELQPHSWTNFEIQTYYEN